MAMKHSVKTCLGAALVALSITLPTLGCAEENPLLVEMMMLNKAYRDIVSAVAIEDSPAIVKAIEGLEASAVAKMTEEGLETGKIKTPKNPDKLKEFKRMDAEFHKNLGALAAAAKENKQPKIRLLTKKLLDGCVKCHSQFRK